MDTQQLAFLDSPSASFDGMTFTPAAFGGKTYEPARDEARLTGQLAATRQAMSDGRWWTLADLAREVGRLLGRRASEAAISARIRDLRKPQFGGHQVTPRNEGGGLWVYRLERP